MALHKKTSGFYLFFIVLILLSSLFYTRLVLDWTLSPRLFLVAFLLGVFFLIALFRNKSLYIPLRIPFFLYLAFTIWVCISLVRAVNKEEAIFEASRQMCGFLTFWIVISFAKNSGLAASKSIIRLSLVLSLVALAVGVLQGLEVGEFTRVSIYQLTGISSHKNLFASFLFLLLYFCLAGFLTEKKGLKYLSGFCVLAIIAVVIILQSRAVLLGLIVTLLFFVLLAFFKFKFHLLSYKWVNVILVFSFIAIVFWFAKPVIAYSLNYLPENNKTESLLNSSSGEERFRIWDNSMEMIKEHPMLGVGAGNWQIFFPKYTLSGIWRVEELNVTFQRPHNDLLWIFSETGWIGISLYSLFLSWLIFGGVSRITSFSDTTEKRFLALTLAFIVGFLALSLLDFPRERIEHTLWFNLLLAVAFVRMNTLDDQFAKTNRITALFLSVLCFAIASVGYLRVKGEFCMNKTYISQKEHKPQKVIVYSIKACSFAYSIDPFSIPVTWYRGNAHAVLHQFKEATSDFWIAYQQNPFNRNVLNDLGSALTMDGKSDSAKYFYKEAARISPRFDEPKLNLIAIYINEGNLEEASRWEKTLAHDSQRRTFYKTLMDKDSIKP